MKKLTLLCALADREAALEKLRELGVLHLEPVQAPEGAELEQARAHHARLKRVLEVLPRLEGERKGCGGMKDVDEAVEIIWKALHERKALEEEQAILVRECMRLEPAGSFNPADVEALAKAGVNVRIYQAPADYRPPTQPGLLVLALHRGKEGQLLAFVSSEAVDPGLTEFRMPEQSLRDIQERLRAIEAQLGDIQKRIDDQTRCAHALATCARQAEEHVAYLEARAGMGLNGPVAYIRGYCPAENVAAVQAEAPRQAWAVLAQDPGPDDPVPTLLHNPAWVKPIKAVFDAIGVLPGYDEIDISAVFLLFLSIFFAMLVGDAGYGFLFLGLTWWARRKLPRAPVQPFALMYVMSVSTIAWGVITGTYFGITRLPPLVAGLKIDWLGNDRNLMLLCFFIGALHLTIAHAWTALRALRTLQALAQCGWIMTTWTMYFLARNMVLGEPFPAAMAWVFAAGVLLIVLFMTPARLLKAEWFNHVMLPLSLVSNFVDVVSYLRLFAVGSASLAVASSFNEMALAGEMTVLKGLVAALILFGGHALNIVLSAMGVLVHGIRLNTLEFSSHIGMQWKGRPYAPFARRVADQQQA